MYGIPHDIDLSFLVGAELIQVCVGSNQIQMQFVPDRLSILVVSDLTLLAPPEPAKVVTQFPRDAGALLPLLGRKVAGWKRSSDRTLDLTFDDGVCLTLSDDSDHYESFEISGPRGLLVV
jgi:Family of unknown function (DUF6188)